MVDQVVEALRRELGDNLYSCCLYGSAVRGNLVEGVSDWNVLIVLNVSDVSAHEAVARALGARREVDPFVLGREGFARSVRAFAAKFSSIRRNYRVLFGADPLAGIVLDPQWEKALCEQAVRNLQLRMAYAYVTRSRHRAYGQFVQRTVTPLFLRLSEMVRLQGGVLPPRFEERIPLLEKTLGVDGDVLRDCLALKKQTEPLSTAEAARWHGRLFPVVNHAVTWIEDHWPDLPGGGH